LKTVSNKTIDQRVDEAVKIINAGGPNYLAEASAALLNFEPKNGSRVVTVADTITGMEGLSGVVVGPSKNKGSGFVDVRTEGGTVVTLQSNLLIPV
jgi:hypothetical protein